MKFLIALTVLASATGAFANDRFIKCWETAQGERGRPEYVFKAHRHMMDDNRGISLVKPFSAELERTPHGCLKVDRVIQMEAGLDENQWAKFCQTDGQRINGLIPVEVDRGQWDEVVYCEAELKKYLGRRGDM